MDAAPDGLSSLWGDADRWGVMTFGAGLLNPDMLLIDAFPSLDFVAAGVRGGDCTADVGGDAFGDGSPEPAGNLLLGVVVPDPT